MSQCLNTPQPLPASDDDQTDASTAAHDLIAERRTSVTIVNQWLEPIGVGQLSTTNNDSHTSISTAQTVMTSMPATAAPVARNLPFKGIHSTQSDRSIRSICEDGLDWEKQCANRNDPKEVSGPGFYLVPGSSFQYGDKDKGARFAAVCVSGLNEECGLPEGVPVSKRTATLTPGHNGNIQLTASNHPMTLWAARHTEQGDEIVLRPHLYNKKELITALQVVALMPGAAEPQDFLTRHSDVGAEIKYNEGTESYEWVGVEDEFLSSVGSPNMCSAEMHAAINEKYNREEIAILQERYGGLEMPEPIFKVLLNVAAFDFAATPIRNGGTAPPHLRKHDIGTGAKILPTKEELTALIEAAKKANPKVYDD